MDHFQQGESGWRLEQVALKFSLDLEAEAGVVIARAKTRAGQYFPGRDRVGTDSASTWVILHYFVTVYRFHVETEITASDTRIACPQLSDFILWG